jgi:hypothetical protein
VNAVAKVNDDNIDAFVNTEGDKITVMMMPDRRAWRFMDISAAKARELGKRLLSAADAAENQAQTIPKEAPR